jgi:hypothetical protein
MQEGLTPIDVRCWSLDDGNEIKTYLRIKERSRRHWKTVREFVHTYIVRPYALFWYEYVGIKLCAPGGAWANNDRSAYHNDFFTNK